MKVAWGNYGLIRLGISKKWQDLTPAEAKHAFSMIMDQRTERVRMLGELVELNGYPFGTDDPAVQRVDDFFRANVERDNSEGAGGYPLPEWGSVAYDLGLFLGELLIARFPHLHWKLDTVQKSASANQPVLVGFRQVTVRGYKNPVFGRFIGYGFGLVNPGNDTASVGGRVASVGPNSPESPLLVRYLTAASRLA